MADFQQRDNSGAMFTNQRKTKDSHPDFNGSVMVDGKEYWLSGWKKQSKAGRAFVSLALTLKNDEAFDLDDSKPAVRGPVADTGKHDDDIPF